MDARTNGENKNEDARRRRHKTSQDSSQSALLINKALQKHSKPPLYLKQTALLCGKIRGFAKINAVK